MLIQISDLEVVDDDRTCSLEVVERLLEDFDHFRVRIFGGNQSAEHADPATFERRRVKKVGVVEPFTVSGELGVSILGI